MISLDEFIELASKEAKAYPDPDKIKNNLIEFKLFWLAQNQINPLKFPVKLYLTISWTTAFYTWKEGGYGL